MFSTYAPNVPREIVEAQARVFAHLGLQLEQVQFGTAATPGAELHLLHGATMERLAKTGNADAYIFFDIDCIPLNRNIIDWCYVPAIEAGAVIGPAQRAGHISAFVYAGPCALGFSRATYERAAEPTLQPGFRFDTGGALSHACDARGIPVIRLLPTHCEKPLWPLHDDRVLSFGHGTTFANGIYHAFDMRSGQTRHMFLQKCEEVLRQPPPSQRGNPPVTLCAHC